MAGPVYPDVPLVAGVPPVFRNDSNPPGAPGVEPMSQDGEIVVTAPKGWGIYTADGKTKALDPDSIFAIEPNREFRISDYPQEAGGFQSYNKVATPGQIRITVTKGGDPAARLAFLRDIDALVETTDLYSVVTPDFAFSNRNIVRYDYRRSAESGVTLLSVDLIMIEVRESAEASFSTTKEPSGANLANGGPVRPSAPTKNQTPPVPPT